MDTELIFLISFCVTLITSRLFWFHVLTFNNRFGCFPIPSLYYVSPFRWRMHLARYKALLADMGRAKMFWPVVSVYVVIMVQFLGALVWFCSVSVW